MSTSALTEFLLSPLFAPPQAHRRGSQLPLAVGNACPLCGERMRDGEMAAMYVVPPVHYASRVADDRVAVCLGCAQVRGVADLAELVTVAPGLLALRQRVLEGGTHHLTPWRDREAIRCELSRRSALPRVHLAAAQADDGGLVIGWSRYSGGAATLAAHAIYLSTFGGVVLDSPSPLTLIHVPSAHLLDAVWSLIERGALISRAGPVDNTRADWRTFWWWHGDDYLAHRDRLGPFLVPIPLPPRTATATSARRREQRRLVAARRRYDAAVASTDPMVVLHAVAGGVEAFVRGQRPL
jgi:hypothetical protein